MQQPGEGDSRELRSLRASLPASAAREKWSASLPPELIMLLSATISFEIHRAQAAMQAVSAAAGFHDLAAGLRELRLVVAQAGVHLGRLADVLGTE